MLRPLNSKSVFRIFSDLKIRSGAPSNGVLADTGRPIGFAADINGSEAMVWVLLWHEDGRVDGLEISWIGDPHPALADLVLVE